MIKENYVKIENTKKLRKFPNTDRHSFLTKAVKSDPTKTLGSGSATQVGGYTNYKYWREGRKIFTKSWLQLN